MDHLEDMIKVMLDKNGKILDFDCSLENIELLPSKESVIGKNWFKTFIALENFDEMMGIFNEICDYDIGSNWLSYKNEIIINDKNYLMNFYNNIIDYNNEKVILCVGEICS